MSAHPILQIALSDHVLASSRLIYDCQVIQVIALQPSFYFTQHAPVACGCSRLRLFSSQCLDQYEHACVIPAIVEAALDNL